MGHMKTSGFPILALLPVVGWTLVVITSSTALAQENVPNGKILFGENMGADLSFDDADNDASTVLNQDTGRVERSIAGLPNIFNISSIFGGGSNKGNTSSTNSWMSIINQIFGTG